MPTILTEDATFPDGLPSQDQPFLRIDRIGSRAESFLAGVVFGIGTEALPIPMMVTAGVLVLLCALAMMWWRGGRAFVCAGMIFSAVVMRFFPVVFIWLLLIFGGFTVIALAALAVSLIWLSLRNV